MLLELTEDEERAVLGPSRPSHSVAGLAREDDTRVEHGLARYRSTETAD
jgi:hypothetical protein